MTFNLRLLLIVTAAIGHANAVVADEGNQPPFKITTKLQTDKVEIEVEKNETVISIRSPVGISQAVIERSSETWPNDG